MVSNVDIRHSSNNYCQHDIEYLPNGNVLILAWELKSEAEAQAAGRTTRGNVWMDHVVEVKPSGSNGGQIVWEWHVGITLSRIRIKVKRITVKLPITLS